MILSNASTNQQRRSANESRTDSAALPASAHLVGIRGSGMKALAEYLSSAGCRVTGSDLSPSLPTENALREGGYRVHQGHDKRFVPEGTSVLIYSPAIGLANPERRFAQRMGIPQLSYSQMLGRLMRQKQGVCVAGTHGKSTTSALTAYVLQNSGVSPSAVIGAELCSKNLNGWAGEGSLFVAESCEYQRSFLDLFPYYAAITNIEPDHFDYFKNQDDMTSAYAEFVSRIPVRGHLLLPGNCLGLEKIQSSCQAKVSTFSLERGADWWATDIKQTAFGLRFRLFHQGDYFSEISLQKKGKHNVSNAMVAAILCHTAGIAVEDIREGIYEFPGIHRRFERMGSYKGLTLFDDYAHHPTAIQSTLKMLRQEYPDRKIWCLYEPHQVSRTQALMEYYARSFKSADEVLISPVYAAREKLEQEPFDISKELVKRTLRHNDSTRFSSSLDQMVSTLETEAQSGDIIITMGAGEINRIHYELNRRLQSDS
ncbi:UDP-N-acetylmuramate--L-alanine ligase [Gimesia aquarii]|uniref:UDP-N-acetylmuramate--L-alanine ligase n=1 Tax=Gimesia aquarii TaxID=2527964 RepID=A0A517WRH6_9PLAN|nr:UDP-N-acetylmuramate--L-alanine ligase [Gimesia aquarii]QDU07859.1 UDP-N-acetylmuramate--L-alanine ligase MurC [Gimesia aquarii]